MKKLLLACILLSGCSSFYRNLDGTSMSIGLSLPNEELVLIEALNYLSGSKVTVKSPAKIVHSYTTSLTNSYFGIVHTLVNRSSTIEVWPLATNEVLTIEEKTRD